MAELQLKRSSQFKKDLKKILRQAKKIEQLEVIVNHLLAKKLLPSQHVDHPLTGSWRGYRECHITPDWLLIYQIDHLSAELRLMPPTQNLWVKI